MPSELKPCPQCKEVPTVGYACGECFILPISKPVGACVCSSFPDMYASEEQVIKAWNRMADKLGATEKEGRAPMTEYIEREAVLNLLHDIWEKTDNWYEEDAPENPANLIRHVETIPAADVVEVVRCKNCKRRVDFKGRIMCNRNAQKHGEEWYGLTATDKNHFCSYGERVRG